MYDMILAWILFAILWRLYMKPRREGIVALTFGLYYGCCRLLEDSLRIDKRFGPFTGSQWTALTVATISAGILIWWAVQSRSRPRDGDAGDDDDAPRDDTGGDDAGQDGEPERAIGAT
jgi:prolipoprotein diacylglyceryltransferase